MTTKPKREPVNETFRQWTRGVSFVLSMGKTQVATLVAIHTSQNMADHIGSHHKLLRNWVGAVSGLRDRGLVLHHAYETTEASIAARAKKKFSAFYELTAAGEHVVGLLKEAGVYQELEGEFLESDRFEEQRMKLIRGRLA